MSDAEIDIESASREELESAVRDLRNELYSTQARQDALSTQFRKLKAIMLGDLEIVEVEDQADVVSRLEDLEEGVDQAKSYAKSTADPKAAGVSKKDVATKIARKKLVIETALRSGSTGKVSLPSVKDSAEPDWFLDNRTVLDGFDDLAEMWEEITVERGDPGPHGKDSKITTTVGQLSSALVRTVAEEVENENVATDLRTFLKKRRGT